MALPVEEIKKLITSSIPDASIEIKDLMGDNNHYSATIKSKGVVNKGDQLDNIVKENKEKPKKIEENPQITSLDLRSKNIADEGVRALAEALKTNTTLKKLDLRGSDIGKDMKTNLIKIVDDINKSRGEGNKLKLIL